MPSLIEVLGGLYIRGGRLLDYLVYAWNYANTVHTIQYTASGISGKTGTLVRAKKKQ